MSLVRFIYKILGKEWKLDANAFCEHYRKMGIKIGKNTIVYFGRYPFTQRPYLDFSRPSLLEIGDNVVLHEGLRIFTHDFVSRLFINKYDELLPSSGRVVIGDNVCFGVNCTVLKGVTIGEYSYIGAGSVVNKNIPPYSIAAGVPCRVLCTLDQYYEKRKMKEIIEAIEYAKSIQERFGRRPISTDFFEEFPLFIDSHNYEEYPELHTRIKDVLNIHFESWLEKHKAQFDGLEDFLKAAGFN